MVQYSSSEFEFFKEVNVKVTKIVEASFKRVFCGYGGLEITDQDGNKINIKMTEEYWKTLDAAVSEKANQIRKSDEILFEKAVEEEVEKRQKLEESKI